MSWLNKIFKDCGWKGNAPEDVVRFYQQLGFFGDADPNELIRRYTEEQGEAPDPAQPWDDVFLLAYAGGEVWVGDPEADVCAENEVYSEVLPEWARISRGAFAPVEIYEQWESDGGPITLSFQLGDGRLASVSPGYLDDWIDLDVLRKINRLIASSGRQFVYAVDGNFALVLCLTPEQKATMRAQRQFPFAW